MTFDFTTIGEVRVTMDKCIDDILSGYGVETTKVTPATSALFNIRDAPINSTSVIQLQHAAPTFRSSEVQFCSQKKIGDRSNKHWIDVQLDVGSRMSNVRYLITNLRKILSNDSL